MPKIRKEYIRIRHQNKDLLYHIEIMYSDKEFYAVIPVVYNVPFDNLDETELKKYFARKQHPRGYSNSTYKRIVYGGTEQQLLDRVQEFISFIVKQNVIERNVIIVSFSGGGGEKDYQQEKFPSLRLELHFIYCIESKIGDNKPIYNRLVENHFEKGKLERVEIRRSWRDKDKDIVIDDTPENRKFLENLYDAIKTLISKLSDFIATPEALLKFISSKQKLLN